MRGSLSLLWTISLVLDKVCEATFRGATAGRGFPVIKDLPPARYLQSGGVRLSRKEKRQKKVQLSTDLMNF